MAEAAAAAIAAEQVVATGVEAAAVVAVAAPTLPLKVSLTQLANPAPAATPHPALARSHHSLTVLKDNAFIFGGEDASRRLFPPGIHTVTLPAARSTTDPSTAAADTHATAYTCYPPYPLQDAATGEVLVPCARAEHAACARGGRFLLVHGGRDDAGQPVAEGNCLWQWDCETLSWSKLRGDTQLGAQMAPRYGHWMFADEEQRFVVLVGGRQGSLGEQGAAGPKAETEAADGIEREAWMYDFETMVWTALPSVPAAPVAAAYAAGRLYAVSRGLEDGAAGLGGTVHYLDLRESATERTKPGALVWQDVGFSANTLAPGPRPRGGGALVPLTTGHGREYLVYMFGEGHSDIWTLQLPARSLSAAAAKDRIREAIPGTESGEFRWAEAEIVPVEQMTEEGKVHPGPLAYFGAGACLDGRGIVLWGGINAKGESEGDGWLLRLAHGYADNDRRE